MNPTLLINKIRDNRSYIRAYREDVLVALLEHPCGDPGLRARIAAELTARAWLLSGGAPFHCLPERTLFEKGWSQYGHDQQAIFALSEFCERQYHCREYDAPVNLVESSPVFSRHFGWLMANWKAATGVIPFVNREEDSLFNSCLILPFFSETIFSLNAEVFSARGCELHGLTEGVNQAVDLLKEMNALLRHESLRIVLTTLDSGGLPLVGGSLGLPVAISEFLRQRQPVHCLAVGATGSLSHRGVLSVDLNDTTTVLLKAQYLARVGFGIRIFPLLVSEAGDSEVLTFDEGQPLSDRFELLLGVEFKEHIRTDRGLFGPETNVEDMLEAISTGMRYGSIEASNALSTLTGIQRSLKDRSDIRSLYHKVRSTELMATAYCHVGDTQASCDLTNSILDMEVGVGSSVIAEALLRQAVNCTDFADYQTAVQLCDQADGLTNQLSDPVSQLDNHLKSISTKAQASIFAALLNGDKAPTALHLAETAAKLARDLDGDGALSGQKNHPRNLNYVLLYFALHEPGQAIPFYNRSENVLRVDSASMEYTYRTLWLAGYRSFLAGGADDVDLEQPICEKGWLRALCCKYRGTLLASRGDYRAGISDFQEARNITDSHPNLIRFIGATSSLQAGELLLAHDRDFALEQLEYASNIFREMDGWFIEPSLASSQWLKRSESFIAGNEAIGLPNPQHFYPY